LAAYDSPANAQAVDITSIGHVGPAVLHAVALEPELFSTVCLRQCLRAWSDVIHTPLARNQLVSVVHGALRVYDLPDLAAMIPPGKLATEEPLDATGQPIR
jgi:hypothetical protein